MTGLYQIGYGVTTVMTVDLWHQTIDAHAHLLGDGFTPDVLREAEALGVEHFVVSNIGDYLEDPSREQIRALNAQTAELVNGAPGWFSGYAYLNPRHGSWNTKELDRCFSDGLMGVKLWVATLADDPRVLPLVEAAADHCAPVLVHAWDKAVGQLPHESTAHHVARLAGMVPDAVLIMAHLGGFIPTALDTVRDHPNVHVDTSGTIIGAGDVARAVATLGASRVIFGSDATMACLAANVGKVLDAGLDLAAAQQVMGGNMVRILGQVDR